MGWIPDGLDPGWVGSRMGRRGSKATVARQPEVLHQVRRLLHLLSLLPSLYWPRGTLSTILRRRPR